ncbi:MAG: signal recognition particle receptor subunit alpha [Clostridia bacterium]
MLENLSDRLQRVVKKIKGETRLTKDNMSSILRELKLSLLEADVNYKVVKSFIENIETKACGSDVLDSLKPSEQVIKIVRDELKYILGDTSSKLNVSSNPPTVIMVVGLQGSGKTTLCGKLGLYLKKKGKKPCVVACDVYRPAAKEQLITLAKGINIDYYSEDGIDVELIAKNGLKHANSKLCDTVIIDTAGRLQIDDVLMNEIITLKKCIKPHEIMLVVDSMIGQESVNVASTFNEKIGIDSISITKLDSDTRGGAILSIKSIVDKPIKFASVGEKLNELEEFYPDRVASRILRFW